MKILITSGSWNAALVVMKSLAKRGCQIYLLDSDSYCAGFRSRHCSGGIVTPRESDRAGYIDALIKIIDNSKGLASGKIYNIGNPRNNFSIKELAEMMLDLAPNYHHFKENAPKIRIVSITSNAYYGEGYQDMQNRSPHIDNTMQDLDWEPKVTLREALHGTFEAYVEELKKTGK